MDYIEMELDCMITYLLLRWNKIEFKKIFLLSFVLSTACEVCRTSHFFLSVLCEAKIKLICLLIIGECCNKFPNILKLLRKNCRGMKVFVYIMINPVSKISQNFKGNIFGWNLFGWNIDLLVLTPVLFLASIILSWNLLAFSRCETTIGSSILNILLII